MRRRAFGSVDSWRPPSPRNSSAPWDPGFLTQLCLGALEASLHYSHRHPEEAVGTCVDRAMDCLICGVGVQS